MAVEQIYKFSGTYNASELLQTIDNNFATIDARTGFDTFQDYGLACDGITDDTSDFRNMISSIGSDNKVFGLKSDCILGDATEIIIPNNIQIWPLGGKLIINNNAVLTFKGNFPNSHIQIFQFQSQETANLPVLQIDEQEFVSPVWFGWKMSGSNADALNNYHAFRAAWNCAGRLSDVKNGSSIQFPSGVGYCNPIYVTVDGWDLSAKFSKISGVGKRKTIIKLASNSNAALIRLYDNFDFDFQDIEFDGNKDNNTSMTEPVLWFNYYRIGLKNFTISNFNKIGIQIDESQTNAIHIENPNIILGGIESTGIKITGPINLSINGLIDIENCTYGIDIYGNNTTIFDSRYNSRINITGSWYGEQVIEPLRLFGISGVYARFQSYSRESGRAVGIYYDNIRNMPSMFNLIDVRGNRDEKTVNDFSGIYVEDKCPFNRLYSDPGLEIIDNDGRNSYNGSYWGKFSPINNWNVTSYVDSTNPKDFGLYLEAYEDGVFFNDIIGYDVNGLTHVKLTAGGTLGTYIYNGLGFGTNYFILRLKGVPGANSRFAIFNQGNGRYDHARKYFEPNPEPQNTFYYHFDFNGEWQDFIIPFEVTDTNGHNGILYATNSELEVAYINLVDNKNTGFLHKKGGNIIGYNNNSHVNSVSLPLATNVTIGTKNFCPDLGHEVISDGNNWKKPDGTNI